MDPKTQQLVLACAGAGGASEATYVDDVFSTFLAEGAGGQTITNGIDLSTEGGMVWSKARDVGASWALHDTERGVNKFLSTNTNSSETDVSGTVSHHTITSFNTDGFTTGNDGGYGVVDLNGYGSYAHFTFRKAPGFFDVVTWTGNGSNRTISHSLGSTPGFIIIKRISDTEDWTCWHRSVGATKYLQLNGNGAEASLSSFMNDTEPTSTNFTVGTHDRVNTNGETYVAYVFAHDDQSFGDDSDEDIIQCGSYSGTGSAGNSITLGFEPQWLMVKRSDGAGSWFISDMMRGMTAGDEYDPPLLPNSTDTESNNSSMKLFAPTPTGFECNDTGYDTNGSGATYIYIAIRRPHKPPTDADDVFAVSAAAGNSDITTNFPVDLAFQLRRSAGSKAALTRLQGKATLEIRNSTAQTTNANAWYESNTKLLNTGLFSADSAFHLFKRAPGFMDVVSYQATGSTRTVSHGLTVEPELIIIKCKNFGFNWTVYSQSTGNTKYLSLNSTAAEATATYWNSTTPTSTVFTVVGGPGVVNASNTSALYNAYLFATLAGISKVGSYTGTGSDINVDCGFTAGARFVLIKRTDSTGDWYFYDTARGIASGNDPYIANPAGSSTDEVTNTDYIDPLNSGFTVTSSAPAALNASGGTYLFLAIA